MTEYANIVLTVLGSCVNAVVTLFDRLGALPYMLGAVAFLAVCRYMLLPLLDYGSAITSPRIYPDVSMPVKTASARTDAQIAAAPDPLQLGRAGDPANGGDPNA